MVIYRLLTYVKLFSRNWRLIGFCLRCCKRKSFSAKHINVCLRWKPSGNAILDPISLKWRKIYDICLIHVIHCVPCSEMELFHCNAICFLILISVEQK